MTPRLRKITALVSLLAVVSLLTGSSFLTHRRALMTAPSLTSLKAWYKLEGLKNTVGTGPGNLVQSATPVTFVAGQRGNAARIVASTSSYLKHADHADLKADVSTAFSASAWVKFRTGGTDRALICKSAPVSGNNGWALQMLYNTGGNTELRFQMWDATTNVQQATYTLSGLIGTDKWIHISGTASSADPAILRCYINGVLGASTGSCTGRNTETANLVLGGFEVTPVFYDVDIDDVGIWKGAELTQENVNWLANNRSYTDLPGASPFSPVELSTLYAWYDASNGPQESDTSPPEDTDEITVWTNRSGAAPSLVKNTTGASPAGPTWIATGGPNGGPVARFDADGERIQKTGGTWTITLPMTMFAVFKSSNTGFAAIMDSTAGTRVSVYRNNTTGFWAIDNGSGQDSATTVNGNWHYMTVVAKSGANDQIWLDGASIYGPADAGTNSAFTDVFLGNNNGTNALGEGGDFTEFIFCAGDETARRTEVEAYLKAKYGL